MTSLIPICSRFAALDPAAPLRLAAERSGRFASRTQTNDLTGHLVRDRAGGAMRGRGRLSAPTVPAQLATAGEVAEAPANTLVSSRSASTQTTGDPHFPPWHLVLSSGEDCTFITGAGSTSGDKRVNYQCKAGSGGLNLVGTPTRYADHLWRIGAARQQGTKYSPEERPREIERAYYGTYRR